MAGHSKWANIRHKKAKEDLKRAKIFTKIIREITIAAREGGGNPEGNARLYLAIENAKGANVPKDKIQRAIDSATGKGNQENYVEVSYEGYGPGGVAYIVEGSSDNINRTVGEVRHIFTKHGGKLGETGSVGYLFEQKGEIRFETDSEDEWAMMELASDFLIDVRFEDGVCIITTARDEMTKVKRVFEEGGFQIQSAELVRVPLSTVEAEEEHHKLNYEMFSKFEENMDISSVFWNLAETDEFKDKYYYAGA
jgi:YebC/PmpR family DNA-binding regulatory protein